MKQFNSAADLAAYPRTEHDDAAKHAPLGAHLLYAPNAADGVSGRVRHTVSVSGVSKGLCVAFRPGHFDGVATVVTKLFLQTRADFAFFGEKDFQQLHVVRRLVRDLDIPIEIIACPTVREADGLAISSRNVRLSVELLGNAKAPRNPVRLGRAAVGGSAGRACACRGQASDPFEPVGDFGNLSFRARLSSSRMTSLASSDLQA